MSSSVSASRMRVHLDSRGADPPAVLLPLDRLFEVRVAAASGYGEHSTAAILARTQRRSLRPRVNRLVLALRALDGRLDGATHREIATVVRRQCCSETGLDLP